MRASTATTATDVVRRVAALLPGRLAIDGPDAAGKTTLALAVATAAGVPVLHADDFLAPEPVRHADDSPEWYYAHAFDLAALRAAVLAYDDVVVEGVFLLRPELDDLWTARVLLDVTEEEQERRVLARDAWASPEAMRERYDARYRPAYAAYRALVAPERTADLLL